MQNFYHTDACSAAWVERGAYPVAFAKCEGGVWNDIHPAARHLSATPHSMKFSDGRQWDEINGWRGESKPRDVMRDLVLSIWRDICPDDAEYDDY